MNVIVIVKVNGVDYLTRVQASGLLAAEHVFLDRSYCGKHEYGVEGAHAFSSDNLKTDCFTALALSSSPVSNDELFSIIDSNNSRIKREDGREKTLSEIAELEKRISVLRSKLEF